MTRHPTLLRLLLDCAADARYGVRQLRRAPVFAGFAVVTLALAIGANTALFSMLDALLLKRLPVAAPERLVSAILRTPSGGWMTNVPVPLYQELQRAHTAFASITGYWQEPATVSWGRQTERPLTQRVSGTYFRTLGIGAFLGRLIEPADDRAASDGVAVLDHAFWVQAFGADPAAVGRRIVVDGTPHTIIGVTPPGFFGLDRAVAPAVTVPLGDPKRYANIWVVGRLRDGVSDAQAQAETDRAWRRALEALRPTLSRYSAKDRDEVLAQRGAVMAADRSAGGMGLLDQVPSVEMLAALSMVVLLIACANLATLLLGRAEARAAELRTRHAIGASRGRLIRQLAVESSLLAAIGATGGVTVGYWVHRILVTYLVGDGMPAGIQFTLDARLLLFTVAVSALATLVFGVVPAARLSSSDRLVNLTGRDGNAVSGRTALGRTLLVAQVAGSVVLVVIGVLLARSLGQLRSLDTGFDADRLVVVTVGEGPRPYKGADAPAYYQRLMDAARRVPGVQSIALAANDVFGGRMWRKTIWPATASDDDVAFNAVSPHFFAATGTRVHIGRDFTVHDRVGGPNVVIVNETFARRFCGSGVPLGCRFGDQGPASRQKFEVVGIVADAKYGSLRDTADPMVYEPLLHDEHTTSVIVHARVRGNTALTAARLQEALSSLDGSVPVYNARTVAQQVDESLRTERVLSLLSALFGGLAVLVTLIGVFGVVTFGVERRRREIAVRLALGAAQRDILRVTVGETLVLVSLAVVGGAMLAMAVAPALRAFLFGISPRDTPTVIAVACGLLSAAAIAAYWPARRAIGIDPMLTLRHE